LPIAGQRRFSRIPTLCAFTAEASTYAIAARQHADSGRKHQPSQMQQPHGRLALPLLQQPVKHKSVMGPFNEAVRANLCGNLPTTDIDGEIDSDRLDDMIYGCEIVDQDGSDGELSLSNFTEECDVDVEAADTRDFMALFREQLCEILEVHHHAYASSSFGQLLLLQMLFFPSNLCTVTQFHIAFFLGYFWNMRITNL
jgi:hypothetical protein